MIYLDNAATSYPKPEQVYAEMDRCMRSYCANPGRGGHNLSFLSGNAVLNAREEISKFFGINNCMQLCFTKNATEALNIAIWGSLMAGDHVITTCMEHNSVIRPLKTLEKSMGIEVTIVRGDVYGQVDPKDIKKSLKSNTKLIACTLSSNVNGIIMPVKEIGQIADENGVLFLLDASQGAGMIKIDVNEFNVDMLAFPGHKGLLGPQGTGGIYVKEGLCLKSIMQGGTGSNSENLYQPEFMPDVLESGTLNTPGVVGLAEGIKFINRVGLDEIKKHKHMLLTRFYDGLKEIKHIKCLSRCGEGYNSGIIALNVADIDSTEVSYVLDKVYNVATRAGLHCAPLAHETLNTVTSGVVRFSVSYFNKASEIDVTLEALREIVANA